MQGRSSRRIQGRGTIKRPEENQTINTTYLPHERTIQSVNYYTRRKQELKRNYQNVPSFNRIDKNAQKPDLKNQIKNMMRNNGSNDPHNHIRQVHVEPIMNEKQQTNFNEDNYPLQQSDRVAVVEERYFPTQNYYNYMYELELKKEINRFVNQTEAKVLQVVKDQRQQKPLTESSEMMNEKSEHYVGNSSHSHLKVKVNRVGYQSKVNREITSPNLHVTQLVPVHMDYTGNNYQNNLIFTVNENKRMQLSRRT